MLVTNNNHTIVGGSRVLLSVKDAGGVYGPYVKVGVVDAVSPARTKTEIKLKDGSYGIAKDIDSRTVETSTSFTIKTYNLGPRNWQLLLGSEAIETFTQAAATITDQAVTNVWNNSSLLLVDGSGNRVYDLSAVHVEFGDDTLVEDQDWSADAVDLKNGVINIMVPDPATEVWAGDGTDDITVTFTKAAISGGRLLKPGVKLDFDAKMMLIQSDGGSDDQHQVPWENIFVKLSGNSMELPQNNFGSITLTATIMAQNTSTPEGSAKILGPIAL